VAAGLTNLGAIYESRRKYRQADALYRRALAIDEKRLGPENSILVLDLNNLGCLNVKRHRYEEAEPLLRRSLALGRRVQGPDHPSTPGRPKSRSAVCHAQALR
jgi:Flp pilus assembly protein TadD